MKAHKTASRGKTSRSQSRGSVFLKPHGKDLSLCSKICVNNTIIVQNCAKRKRFRGKRSMVIENLTLHNFRNYEDETFTFDAGLNVLTGRNAQGKTNCAEAVFYLCTVAAHPPRPSAHPPRGDGGAHFGARCNALRQRPSGGGDLRKQARAVRQRQ